MSRAKAVADREQLDFYATPEPLADAICQRVFTAEGDADAIIEPSAGEGAFVRAAARAWPLAEITAVDLDGQHVEALFRAGANPVIEADWVKWAGTMNWADHPRRTIVIGNPPFREAEAHIRAALEAMSANDVLALLLRINFLGSKVRLDFWEKYPAAWMAPIVPRPSFTRGGTDGTEYAVFCWHAWEALDDLRPPPLTRIDRPIRWEP